MTRRTRMQILVGVAVGIFLAAASIIIVTQGQGAKVETPSGFLH